MKNDPLKTDTKEILHTSLRAGLSMVPVIGGPLVEVFNLLFASPVSKRRDAWITDIALEIDKLKDNAENFDLDKLAKNDEFITILLSATQIALRNHQEEKLNALKNAVINTAKGINFDENEKIMYINLIDRLTPLHLSLIKLFQNPKAYGTNIEQAGMSSISELLNRVYGNANPELIRVAIKELSYMNLLPEIPVNTMMTGSGVVQTRGTIFGQGFIKFITES